MNKKQFFSHLGKNLPAGPYKKRFLEELNDHFEEAEMREQLNRPIQESEILARLGEPHFIVSTYQKLMRKHSNFMIFLEAFFWGLLTLPFYIIPFIFNLLTEKTEILWGKGLIFGATLILMAGIFYILYRFIFNGLQPWLLVLGERGRKGLVALLLSPAWSWAIVFITTSYSDRGEAQDYIFPFVILTYLSMGALAALLSMKHALKTPIKPLGNKWLSTLISLILLAILMFTPLLSSVVFLTAVVFLVPFVAFGKLIWGFWVSGLILTGVGGYGVSQGIQALRRKNVYLPVFKTILGLIFLGFVFYPTTASKEGSMVWNVPVQELTGPLEQTQMGPFYNWEQRIETFEMAPLHYDIGWQENAFWLSQRERIFKLDLSQKAPQWIEQKDKVFSLDLFGQSEFLPDTMTCEVDPMFLEGRDNTLPLTLGGETACLKFYYQDQLIFSQEDPFGRLQNVLVSENGEWMLILWLRDFERPEQVFLVELK